MARVNDGIFDNFSEEALEALDFARCQRADGSFYGTAGQCRTGTPAGAKEESAKAPRAAKGAEVADLVKRIARQERFLQTASPAKYSRGELEIEKKELQRMKSQLAGMKSTMRPGAKSQGDGPAEAKQEEKSKVIQAPGADPAVMRRKELEEEKRMARMRATNERADAREKARKEAKRRSEEDVRRPGGKLIGTSPRNMAIDGLNELKKEAADYKKKFKSRANEEMIGKVLKTYESRIAAQEKFIKDKYGDG
jgi:hypothetical protein